MSNHTAARKLRGAFFTPPALSEYLVQWAVRSSEDIVLEPSCGDAAFLRPAAARLLSLGMNQTEGSQHLYGVDIHAPSAQEAIARVHRETGLDLSGSIHVGDFFDLIPGSDIAPPRADVVVGNPPFVRYQDFCGAPRARSRQAALAAGVNLPGLASSWAAFVAHAATFLHPSGRLGLVLPAELLSVNYAAPVRRFLLQRFRNVRLILFEERVFPGVLEEVVLLLAEGEGPCDHFDLMQVRDIDGLPNLGDRTWTMPPAAGKWSGLVLPDEVGGAIAELEASGAFHTLGDWGSVGLGAVTGGNDFFCLSESDVEELGLERADLLRISPPGSRHLRSMSFVHDDWEYLREKGARVYLFFPHDSRLTDASALYVERGEREGRDSTYKCRSRRPWWKVPVVTAPHLFLTYMNHQGPRLIVNSAAVTHVNSVHGVRLSDETRSLGQTVLPLAGLSSATLLGAELVGRAYGGGLLKLEPREALRLPVPKPETLEAARLALARVSDAVAAAVARSDLGEAATLVDAALLRDTVGVSREAILGLALGRELMFARRSARGRS
ncbi:MAG: HsdM family class I SAM-dependent methyltransferase [Thermoleophilia bacterium]